MRIATSVIIAAVLSWTTASFGQTAVYNKPIYDPASKSYFELVKLTRAEAPKHYTPAMNYAEGHAFARKRVFKGVNGRLAVIKAAETHSLILLELRPRENTLIGLRYFCKTRTLQWSSGDLFDPRGFQAWHQEWDQSSSVGCKEGGFMPISYTAVTEGFRWIAKGGLKVFADLLIEYPTGTP